jgi:hypothetical protein
VVSFSINSEPSYFYRGFHLVLHDGSGASLSASVSHPQAQALFGNLPAHLLTDQAHLASRPMQGGMTGEDEFSALLACLVLDESAWFDCHLNVRISLDENDVMQQSFVKLVSIQPIIEM